MVFSVCGSLLVQRFSMLVKEKDGGMSILNFGPILGFLAGAFLAHENPEAVEFVYENAGPVIDYGREWLKGVL